MIIYPCVVLISLIIISFILWYLLNNNRREVLRFFIKVYKTPKYIILALIFILSEVFVYKRYGFTFMSLIYLIMISIIFTIAIEDYRTMFISNKLIISLLVIGVLFLPVNKEVNLINASVAFLICGGLLFGLSKLTKEAIGMGDVKVLACLGIWLGTFNLLTTILYGSILSAIAGCYFIYKDANNKKKPIPFMPFVLAGLLLNLLL